MSIRSSRREFLSSAAVIGASIWVPEYAWGRGLRSPNERINFACIGVGGKGDSDTMDASRHGNIVALCDVDESRLNKMGERFPNAKKYTDFRKMLDEMGKEMDAVTVSTPDHTHAPAAAMAMLLGKHCFCQKPLTHSIYEARRLAEIARKMKVATQMGNQGTASSGLRKSAAMIKAGVLGTIRELHVWTNRPVWPQGGNRPASKTAPANLQWDLWLGPAPERPYGEGYHPFAWRGWWDFGTGALGDMACHTLNMPFMALDLRNPTSVRAETSGHNKDSYPQWSIIEFEFPATKARPALKMTWYDGGKLPPPELLEDIRPSSSGSLVVGEKGKLYTPGDYGDNGRLMGEVTPIEVNYPQSPGHFEEFARAIKEQTPAMSNFPDYAGPLTETVLLGNLAVWANGKKIEWDARKLHAKNAPEVESIIRPKYRAGYSLG
jgi:predicted dehydrogenase